MKIALVHDWLVTYAGAERVLEQLLELYPEADVFAVIDFFSDEDRARHLKGKHAKTTFIQSLPGAKHHYQKYLPLMPIAIEQLDLSEYDLIISSSHAVAKGVITGPDQLHISYVHSPIRYAWDMQAQYLKDTGMDHGFKGWLAKIILHYIRIWDQRTTNGVDHFIANSAFIAKRIRKVYGRASEVIYPPVAVDDFKMEEKKEDYYLTASRLVPYKKIGLIVEAFTKMPDKKLIVIGDGQEYKKIRAIATKNITVLGYQPSSVLREKLQKAKAFVFAAKEDFGIAPVEAQACGTPVIAYGKGGARESVRDETMVNPTGIFFYEQTVAAIIEAVNRFEKLKIKARDCRENAERFSTDIFLQNMRSFVNNVYKRTAQYF